MKGGIVTAAGESSTLTVDRASNSSKPFHRVTGSSAWCSRRSSLRAWSVAGILGAALCVMPPLAGQARPGAATSVQPLGDWRYYGRDAGSQKYSPLDQITRDNVKNLRIAWRWKTDNFGPSPEFNLQATPLAVNGILYTTAGTRRHVVAIDGATGETLWTHRYDEGDRGRAGPAPESSRRRVLDRRPRRRAHSVHHRRLPLDCAEREDRAAGRVVRHRRRRRSLWTVSTSRVRRTARLVRARRR